MHFSRSRKTESLSPDTFFTSGHASDCCPNYDDEIDGISEELGFSAEDNSNFFLDDAVFQNQGAALTFLKKRPGFLKKRLMEPNKRSSSNHNDEPNLSTFEIFDKSESTSLSYLYWLNPYVYLQLLGLFGANADPKAKHFSKISEEHFVRERRKRIICLLAYVSFLRYCSFDAFIISSIFSCALLLYYMKNSGKISMHIAKKNIKRRVGWAKQWAGGLFLRKRRETTENGIIHSDASYRDDNCSYHSNETFSKPPNIAERFLEKLKRGPADKLPTPLNSNDNSPQNDDLYRPASVPPSIKHDYIDQSSGIYYEQSAKSGIFARFRKFRGKRKSYDFEPYSDPPEHKSSQSSDSYSSKTDSSADDSLEKIKNTLKSKSFDALPDHRESFDLPSKNSQKVLRSVSMSSHKYKNNLSS